MTSQPPISIPPLLSLKQMGIIEDERQLTTKTVIILGANQIGSIVAEALVKCGLSKLILFDYEKEGEKRGANETRMEETKIEALKDRLLNLNPALQFEYINLNVTLIYNFSTFVDRIKSGSISDSKIDLLIDCSNDFDVQMSTNIACNKQNQTWITCVCSSPLTGYVRLFEPGRTACFLCNQFMNTQFNNGATSRNTSTANDNVLPSTQSVLGGLVAQMATKFLFNFGQIHDCVSYDAFYGTLSSSKFAPNSQCNESACCQRQQEAQNLQVSQCSTIKPAPSPSTATHTQQTPIRTTQSTQNSMSQAIQCTQIDPTSSESTSGNLTQSIQIGETQFEPLNLAFKSSFMGSNSIIDLTESQPKADVIRLQPRMDRTQLRFAGSRPKAVLDGVQTTMDAAGSRPKTYDNLATPIRHLASPHKDLATPLRLSPHKDLPTPTRPSPFNHVPTPTKSTPNNNLPILNKNSTRKRSAIFIQLDSQDEDEPPLKWSPKTPVNGNFASPNRSIKESPTKENLLGKFLGENATTPKSTANLRISTIKVSPLTFNLFNNSGPSPAPKSSTQKNLFGTPKTTLNFNKTPIMFADPFRFADHLKLLNGEEKLKNVRNLKFNMTGVVKEIKDGAAVLYTACSTRNCKRRVNLISDARYSCSNCGIRATCKTAYRVELCVEDLTDKAEIIMFDHGAEKLFGIGAVELKKLFDDDPDEYRRIIYRPIGKRYDFEVRYDVKKFNGALALTLISNLCGPYDPKRYEQNLQKRADPTRL